MTKSRLVELTRQSHNIDLYLAYGTDDNFTGAPIYQRAAAYLHEDAEALMAKAIDLAAVQGWRFLVFDAFRPSQAQWKLWHHTPDPEFLADPNKGSPHSRGVAIDLTLIDGDTGEALDMGTGFDAFTPLSHHANRQISAHAQENRYRLLGLMTAAGWDCYINEWWHYQMFDAKRYPVLGDCDAPVAMMAG
ncbi:MAG TPA: D-alanyl-D-alanine dipeptidase [Rhodospirillales bacterium]|nr:D-alanyl-D-alanine dipeptidase [Rhodospirillales bacterium]